MIQRYLERYQMLRGLGVSRRRAAWRAAPTRLHVVLTVLQGNPVAYRLTVYGGLHLDRSGTIVAECLIMPHKARL